MNDKELQQAMLSLSYTADLSSGRIGGIRSITEETEKSISCALANASVLKGKWKLVWGPVVTKLSGSYYPDNTMFVAQNIENPSWFTVAVAGTDSNSIPDWLVEDLWVGKQVDWLYGSRPSESSPKISQGTCVGLNALQGMSPIKGMVGASLTLTDFLSQQVSQAKDDNVVISVTGHSLGGALAPTLALWLKDTKGDSGFEGWDKRDKVTIKIVGFATPTPGNYDFAKYLNSQFKDENMIIINNNLDIVPHAWNSKTMKKIPHLYHKEYRPNLLLHKAILCTAWAVRKLNYTLLGQKNQVHHLNGSVWAEHPLPKSQYEKFLYQVQYQHVPAYPELLGIPELTKELKSCRGNHMV